MKRCLLNHELKMNKAKSFKQNLEKWAVLNPDAAKKIETLNCKEVFLTKNDDGSLNLKKISDSSIQYYHSTENPLREAQQWFLTLDLKDAMVLYVYGIGIGYYYEVIKDWLKEDAQRFVVFLEDNLEVIKCFLETERSGEFLKNPQAKLFYFSWEMSYFSFSFITSLFALLPFKISILKFYGNTEPTRLGEFYARISYFYDVYKGITSEFLTFSPGGFIANFYKNLLDLPKGKLELKMIGHFKNIPAIICGAGPSLAKNIHVLKNLQDKALIMAGGTAMNVLNGAGIKPHFGLGIDPNPSHYNRLISNIAFEEPFFYRQRMYNKALKTIHGEHIYVTGAGGYRLPSWFEKRLEIPRVDPIEEGHNVVNFNLAIAKELGCNPILIVGVDLAYSDNLSYAPGLVRHAIHDPKDAFITKYGYEELLIKNDINGVPVNTLWKWVNESLWFSQFAEKNPELTLLNCTEGGIGFSRVPNMKLVDAEKKYLNETYEFSSLIHGEIQNSLMPTSVNKEHILESFEALTKSLLHCESFCGTLSLEFGKIFQRLEKEEFSPEIYKVPIIKEFLDKLEGEEAFRHHLVDYKEKFLEIFFPRLLYLESDSMLYSDKDIMIKRTFFEVTLYTFLSKVARHNINLIGITLKNELTQSPKPVEEIPKETLQLSEILKKEYASSKNQEHYSYHDNLLTMIDPEIDLHYTETCDCQKKIFSYPSGTIQSMVHRLGQKLHGPVSYYSEQGELLAQNWYIKGRLEGKGLFYYPTGEIYAIKRYKHGDFNGRQEYYYRNGLPKSLLEYKNGLLENEVLLFHENGRIKRQIQFSQGKKNGLERMWNENGLLVLEAHYDNDIPDQTAREWYENGNLAKEIIYEVNSDRFEIKQWEEDGKPIRQEETRGKDYFDLLAGHSKKLNTSLQNIYQTLANLAPSLPETKLNITATSLEHDLLALKQEMDKLNKYNQEMLQMGGYLGNNPKEALWKTPEMEKLLKAQLESVSKKLTDITKDTQVSMQNLYEKLKELKMQGDDKSETSERDAK